MKMLIYTCYNFISPIKSGWTGVLAAARYGFADVVKELITKFGCDRNAVNKVSACDSPVVKVVLRNAVSPWLQGGLNALLLATIGNHVEIVRALVGDFGLSLTHRDNVRKVHRDVHR